MGLFSKEGVDVIDLPELHRRKLINLPEREKSEDLGQKFTKDGFFDLSSTEQNINSINRTSQEQEKQTISPQTPNSQVTDFLSDFASIGASSPFTQIQETPHSNTRDATNNESEHIKDIKWRIENLEFKLEQLIERVNSINITKL